MKWCCYILFSCICLISKAQEDTLPVFKIYYIQNLTTHIDQYIFPVDTGITYWENGNKSIEVVEINDSVRIHKEYFESGNLKLEATILKQFHRDTFNTYGDYYNEVINKDTSIIQVVEWNEDLLHGDYKQYDDSKNSFPTIKGRFYYNSKKGEWEEKVGEEIYVVNFNNNSEIDGEFTVYYAFDNEPIFPKIKGQYTVIEVPYRFEEINYDTGEWETFEGIERKSMKTGVWFYYDKNVQLSKSVDYNKK